MPSLATTPQIANSRCRMTQLPNTTGTGNGACSVATLTAAMVTEPTARRAYYRSSCFVNAARGRRRSIG